MVLWIQLPYASGHAHQDWFSSLLGQACIQWFFNCAGDPGLYQNTVRRPINLNRILCIQKCLVHKGHVFRSITGFFCLSKCQLYPSPNVKSICLILEITKNTSSLMAVTNGSVKYNMNHQIWNASLLAGLFDHDRT